MDNPVKVMLVDDEKDFIYTMGYWLKSKGYQIISAADGAEALEQFKKDPADIVFLDLHMPVMDGIETLKNLRKISKTIPVIIITAYAEEESLNEIEKYGISGLFSKDRDFSEGAALIETVLRRHKSLRKEEIK